MGTFKRNGNILDRQYIRKNTEHYTTARKAGNLEKKTATLTNFYNVIIEKQPPEESYELLENKKMKKRFFEFFYYIVLGNYRI